MKLFNVFSILYLLSSILAMAQPAVPPPKTTAFTRGLIGTNTSSAEFRAALGFLSTNNTVITNYEGNGASITNLNASELRSGTVPLARLTGITATQIADSTLTTNKIDATFLAALGVGSGSGDVTAAGLAAGTVAINGALLTNVNAEFAADTTFNLRGDGTSPQRVIVVADYSSDVGEVQGLKQRLADMDMGRIKIIAYITSLTNEYTAACLANALAYYGHPEIPVGVSRTNYYAAVPNVTNSVFRSQFPISLYNSNYPSAASLIRNVLARQPDASVVFDWQGDMTPLNEVSITTADQYSPLDGYALIGRKTKYHFIDAGDTNAYDFLVSATANATTDEFTHGTLFNAKDYQDVKLTGGTAPAPLALNTRYNLIRINSTTSKFALTYSNAVASNYINLTTTGSGFQIQDDLVDIDYNLQISPNFGVPLINTLTNKVVWLFTRTPNYYPEVSRSTENTLYVGQNILTTSIHPVMSPLYLDTTNYNFIYSYPATASVKPPWDGFTELFIAHGTNHLDGRPMFSLNGPGKGTMSGGHVYWTNNTGGISYPLSNHYFLSVNGIQTIFTNIINQLIDATPVNGGGAIYPIHEQSLAGVFNFTPTNTLNVGSSNAITIVSNTVGWASVAFSGAGAVSRLFDGTYYPTANSRVYTNGATKGFWFYGALGDFLIVTKSTYPDTTYQNGDEAAGALGTAGNFPVIDDSQWTDNTLDSTPITVVSTETLAYLNYAKIYGDGSGLFNLYGVGRVYDVRSYGADPTGVTESQTAIQAAIDAACVDPSKPVYIPAGTYIMGNTSPKRGFSSEYVLSCLTIWSNNVIIVGDGPTLSVLKPGASFGFTRNFLGVPDRRTLDIASATSSGTTVTLNTTAPHGLAPGDLVDVNNLSPSGYNSVGYHTPYTVASTPDSDTFTYTTVASGMAAATVVDGSFVNDMTDARYLIHTNFAITGVGFDMQGYGAPGLYDTTQIYNVVGNGVTFENCHFLRNANNDGVDVQGYDGVWGIGLGNLTVRNCWSAQNGGDALGIQCDVLKLSDTLLENSGEEGLELNDNQDILLNVTVNNCKNVSTLNSYNFIASGCTFTGTNASRHSFDIGQYYTTRYISFNNCVFNETRTSTYASIYVRAGDSLSIVGCDIRRDSTVVKPFLWADQSSSVTVTESTMGRSGWGSTYDQGIGLTFNGGNDINVSGNTFFGVYSPLIATNGVKRLRASNNTFRGPVVVSDQTNAVINGNLFSDGATLALTNIAYCNISGNSSVIPVFGNGVTNNLFTGNSWLSAPSVTYWRSNNIAGDTVTNNLVKIEPYSHLASDFTSVSATLANTDMSVNVVAGRKYSFKAIVLCSDSTSTEGVKIDFGGGSATATNFRVQATAFDTVLNFSTQSSSLTTALSASTFSGNGSIECHGSFEPATSGTFIIRAAQNTHAIGTLTVYRGSSLILTEMP